MEQRTDPVRLDRLTLYELVWSQPIHKLAPKFGLSDVGLGKICKRLNVPRPGRGYWVKIVHGKTLERPPLPAVKAGQPTEVTIEPGPRPVAQPAGDGEVPLVVEVPDQLRKPHPLVRAAAEALRLPAAPYYERSARQRDGHLAIRVDRRALPRALRIMDALIKALEGRGHRVEVRSDSYRHERYETVAVICGQAVKFFMREERDRVAIEPTPAEVKRAARVGSFPPQTRFDSRGSGRLALEIDTYEEGYRRRWADGRRQRLEQCLGAFVLGMEALGAEMHAQHLEREERRRREEEERRRAAEEAERRRIEQEKIAKLRQLTSDWREANEIRAFIAIVRERAPTAGEELREWIAWGLRVADRLDPIATIGEGPAASS